MDKIIPVSGYKDIAQLKQAADHIIESEEGTTYLGFCKPGTATTEEEKWSILKIRESNHGLFPNEITFQWANGSCLFNLKMSLYDTYDYKYKNF